MELAYFCLISFFAVAFSYPCESGGGNNCYYVNSKLTTGNHDGSDWNNAAKSLPDDLQRGFKYFVAKGNYGKLILDDVENGTEFIYITSPTNSHHGTSVGWNAACIAVFNGSLGVYTGYYNVNGQTGGGPSAWSTGYGIKITGHFTAHYGTLIAFYNSPSNVTLTHLEITPDNTQWYVIGLYDGGQNGVVSYCYIHDLYGPPLQMLGHWNGLLLEYNYIVRSQSDPVRHAEGISDHGSDNIIVRNNIWEDVAGTAAISEISGPDNWEIYGNVFTHTDTPCDNSTGFCHLVYYDAADIISVIYDETNFMTATNWKIYDNSFLKYRARAGISISDESSNIYVYNNLWWCNDTSAYENYAYISGSAVTYDYNFYTKCVFPYSFTMGAHEPPKIELPNWTQSTIDIDPIVDWINKDYRLIAPLQNYPGLELNTSDYNNVDPLGLIRGADGVWDRGAYEYNPSSTTGSPSSTGTTTKSADVSSSTSVSVNTAVAALIIVFVL